MDSVLKQTKPSARAATGRRKRSANPVPITITAVDKDGQSFREDSRTLVITQNGLMIETIHRLSLGTEITVENPALGRKSTGRVKWCGAEQSTGQVKEIGIYLADAEGICGIELAPEETEHGVANKPEGHEPEKPPASAPAQPSASGVPSSERAGSLPALPAEPLVRKPAEPAKPLNYKADEAHVQELDLTSELGRVEASSRGLNSPTFPGLDELTERRSSLAGLTPETFAPPPVRLAAIPSDTVLPIEQLNSAVEGALSLLERRIGEIVPVQSSLFEQKLEVLTQQSVALVQARLQESVAALEPKIADLLEKETHLAAAEDRLRLSRAEVESQLRQVDELQQKVHGSLHQLAAQPAAEPSVGLKQSVKAALEQHVTSLAGKLQNSWAEVDGLLARLEEQRQQAQASLQESASRLEEESVAKFEQRITAAVDQQLGSAADRLKGSRAEVEGLLARLEEQRQQAQATLQESASRLEEESAAKFEQRITAAVDQQLGSAADRLKGSRAEVEGLLARLEEQRQQAQATLQESASRLDEESAAKFEPAGLRQSAGRLEEELASRLEHRVTTSLDLQLASVTDRLQGTRAEVDGWLGRLEEVRQQAQGSLQETAARLEADSGARLEQKITASLEPQLALAAERLQSTRAEMETLLAHVEETGNQVQASLHGSVGELEKQAASYFQQHLALAEERLQSGRLEAESLRIQLEQVRQQAQSSLQQNLQQSADQLQQRMAALVETQMASVGERLQGSRAEMEAMLTKLEESRRQAEISLRESVTYLEEKTAASLEQHAADAANRLQSSRTEVETMLGSFEETRRRVHEDLQNSVTQLEQKLTTSLEQQLLTLENRFGGMRAEAEGLLVKLEHVQQASQTEITTARAALQELGSQTVQFALEGVNEKLETEGALSLAQFRSRSAEIVESECHALSQRVSSASDFIKDWSQQAAARLSSHSDRMEARAAASAESRQKQSEQLAAGFMERLQSDALERVQRTAGLLENTTVAAVQARVQKGTQESVETTAAQLRQLAQENLDLVSKQLAEREQQFTSEISEAWHHTFNELVEASSARMRKLTDDSLAVISEKLATRQKLLIDDTTKAFRRKIGDILVMLQNGSGESG